MSRRQGGAAALALVVLAFTASCSSSPPDAVGTDASSAATATATSVARPPGPAADLGEELTGGNGVFVATTSPTPLDAAGYEEHEFVAAGVATSYALEAPFPADGRATARPDAEAAYRTRIVVRRPAAAEAFNGTVVLEWLNVSGGLDSGPDFSAGADEILRSGAAWVGVSAQQIGVEGGPVAVTTIDNDVVGKGLKAIDPARYGSLEHPGDAFSYDIYTQVARAVRDGSSDALGGARPDAVLAVGESQSAFALTTYADVVQPLTRAFDGFLLHSRGSNPLPLDSPSGKPADIASSLALPPAIIRTDLGVPTLILETETDLTSILGYVRARQDDTPDLRLWEVAGTAHADRSMLGTTVDQIDCGVAVNDGPQRFVVRAALRALDHWVRTGTAPPAAPRLEVTTATDSPAIVRDADGIAVGGIRLPPVAVPVATLSGEKGPATSTICLLLGSTIPFGTDRLAQLYPSDQVYLDAYDAATDASIAAGFALEDDREQLLGVADPTGIPG